MTKNFPSGISKAHPIQSTNVCLSISVLRLHRWIITCGSHTAPALRLPGRSRSWTPIMTWTGTRLNSSPSSSCLDPVSSTTFAVVHQVSGHWCTLRKQTLVSPVSCPCSRFLQFLVEPSNSFPVWFVEQFDWFWLLLLELQTGHSLYEGFHDNCGTSLYSSVWDACWCVGCGDTQDFRDKSYGIR